ncbi:MAG: adenine phosphoribosyltransferase [Bacteroidetes bacterium]|nr:MAG: adenine phosphoribosyltransferase [Bacteroidota bacterium]
MRDLTQRLRAAIREVPDFPIPGILFKDISPLFLDPQLIRDSAAVLSQHWKEKNVTKVIGIDSRGFLFGPQMAIALDAGFVMVRKKGKLPPETVEVTYELEYGNATIESVKEAIQPGDRIVVHDDLLATGGTAGAAAKLAASLGAEVIGFSFLVHLSFLDGYEKLQAISPDIHCLLDFAD